MYVKLVPYIDCLHQRDGILSSFHDDACTSMGFIHMYKGQYSFKPFVMRICMSN